MLRSTSTALSSTRPSLSLGRDTTPEMRSGLGVGQDVVISHSEEGGRKWSGPSVGSVGRHGWTSHRYLSKVTIKMNSTERMFTAT